MTRKEREWFKKVGWWFPEDVCAIEPSCEEYVTMVRSSTTSRTQRIRKSMRFLPTRTFNNGDGGRDHLYC